METMFIKYQNSEENVETKSNQNLFGLFDDNNSILYLKFQLSLSIFGVNDRRIIDDKDKILIQFLNYHKNENKFKIYLKKLTDSKLIIQVINDDKNDYCKDFKFEFFKEFQINFPISLNLLNTLLTSYENNLLKLYFAINFNDNNGLLPESIELDKSLLQIFNRPNVELLNDWLFCHSHNNDNKQGDLQDKIKPLILDHIEQIKHVLLNESDEILFESIENKDYNVYIKLEKRNFYITTCKKESKTDNNDDSLYEIKLQNTMMVSFKIFLPYCRRNKDLLKKYRMSFNVQWYQITDDLFQKLLKQLNYYNNNYNKLLSVYSSLKDSTENEIKHMGFLWLYLNSKNTSMGS